MCFSSPDVKTPPAVQEQQAPDFNDLAKARKKAQMTAGAGTMLTGPSGISLQAGSAAGPSLLGS